MKGTSKHIPILQELEQEARSIYRTVPDLAFAAESQPISAARLLAGTMFIVSVANEPLGFALVEPLDGTLYLANIAVRPRAARAGIGAFLLHSVIDEAVRRRLGAVTLTTFREPLWNGPWFRKHGFSSMADAEIGPGLREVLHRHATFLDMATRETLWRKT
jgi:GNAT superfamily N-acetyltransferase